MADDPNDIAQKGMDELFKGSNVLGNPTELRLTGTGSLPGGGAAAALPAPGGPGGVAGGFLGGRQGQEGGGPDSMGLAKSALDAAYKTGKFGQGLTAEPDLGTRGSVGGGGSLSDYLRGGAGVAGALGGQGSAAPGMTNVLGQSTVNPDIANTLQELLGQGMSPDQIQEIMGGLEAVQSGASGVSGAASGLEGLAGGLGSVAGGGAALGAILGLIAQATGDPEIAKAAQYTGAAGSAAGLAGTASALPGAIAAGTAGVGTAAGAVAAPIAAMMLASTISGLVGGDDPVGEGIGEMMEPIMGDYGKFAGKLGANVGQQQQSFNVLEQALPYVQSKEELGQLLNSYKNYLGTTQKAPVEQYGGTGPGDPYSIAKISGQGPVTHGQQTATRDFGPETQALQGRVDELLGMLPGERITAGYGEPGGGLEGPDAIRLWSQFLDRGQNAPSQYNGANFFGAASSLPENQPGAIAAGGHGDPLVAYGNPGYDYAGAGWPEPGKYLGSVSPYWQQLQGRQQQQAAQRTATAQKGLGQGQGSFDAMLSDEQKREMGLI